MTDRRRFPTPGQTIGPFYGFALPHADGAALAAATDPAAVRLRGRVLDGAGEPVPDALVEIWQADARGAVPHETGSFDRSVGGFTGWGRCSTNRAGEYHFDTVLPGRAAGAPAPFIAMVVFARGLLDRLHTRVYVPGSADLDADPFLSALTAADRATLIAREDGPDLLRFDVHLQGEHETVFLAFRPAGESSGA